MLKCDSAMIDTTIPAVTKEKKKFKLNKKELAFIYWRARGYSLVDSVIKAGYKAKSKLIASSYGCQLEKKISIKEAIQVEKLNIFDKSCITAEFVLGNLKVLAVSAKAESDKIRSNELLGKYLALWVDKSINENTNTEKKEVLDSYYNRLLDKGVKQVVDTQ